MADVVTSVWEAARQYRYWRYLATEPCTWCSEPYCLPIRRRWLLVEAASLSYDLAVAEDVARRSVAW